MAKAAKEEKPGADQQEAAAEQQTQHDENVVATYGGRKYESEPVVLTEANQKTKKGK